MYLPEPDTWRPHTPLYLSYQADLLNIIKRKYSCVISDNKNTNICPTRGTLLAEEPAEPVWACQQQQV